MYTHLSRKALAVCSLLLSLCCAFSPIQAQTLNNNSLDHYEIMFSNIIVDHGDVAHWTNPAAEYYITNMGAFPLILSPSDSMSASLQVSIQKDTLFPGETTLALVWYFAQSTGEFQEQILIDVVGMAHPVDLYLKGNILSFPTSENELSRNEFAINNIVLLIDVSSSMRLSHKLPMLKESIKGVVGHLRDIDRLTVITYSSEILNPVEWQPVINKAHICSLIDSLQAGGRSRGSGALHQSYYVLKSHFIEGANNQVIIATDGIFNDRKFTEKQLFTMVEMHKVRDGITTSAFGFGTDKDSRKFMERIAKSGEGAYYHMEKVGDMEVALINEIKKRSKK